MFTALLTAAFWKALAKSPKAWGGLLLAALVAFGLYQTYTWIYERGEANQIKILQPKVDQAESDLAMWKDAHKEWLSRSKVAQQDFDDKQGELVADLRNKLAASEEALKNREVIYREVVKYVPTQVDSDYRLPVGFVRLYSETLQGTAAAERDLGPISFGPGGNVGAPSGVTLSAFADIVGYNNLVCLRSRTQVSLWQQWFYRSKENHDAARAIEWDSAPKP